MPLLNLWSARWSAARILASRSIVTFVAHPVGIVNCTLTIGGVTPQMTIVFACRPGLGGPTGDSAGVVGSDGSIHPLREEHVGLHGTLPLHRNDTAWLTNESVEDQLVGRGCDLDRPGNPL